MVMKRRRADRAPAAADHGARWPWVAFFAATAATALGSTYYHLSPDNDRVVWDRIPIAIACASLLTAVISERVSPRAGRLLLLPLVFAAAGSVLYWYWSELSGQGDLRPYIGVQFGSLLLLAVILVLYREPRRDTPFLVAGLAAYGIAKLCEVADRPIYEIAHLISGHTLKHVRCGGWNCLRSCDVACASLSERRRFSGTA